MNALAQEEDDLLLLTLPAIAASQQETEEPPTEPVPDAIAQVSLLGGRWQFSRQGFQFDDFFRFQASNAEIVQNGSDRGAAILGESHLDENFDFLTNQAVAVYVESDQPGWVILDPFGPPTFDLGSTFGFTQVGDTITASHFFYVPSSGELSTGIATSAAGTRLSNQFKGSARTLDLQEKSLRKLLNINAS